MALPSDPIMLYSAVNMRLRDQYSNLDALCNAEDIDRQQLEDKLHAAGFNYDVDANQFR